jgi:hypothetical protein
MPSISNGIIELYRLWGLIVYSINKYNACLVQGVLYLSRENNYLFSPYITNTSFYFYSLQTAWFGGLCGISERMFGVAC